MVIFQIASGRRHTRAKLSSVFESIEPAKDEAAGTPINRPDRKGRASLPFWTTTTAKKQLRLLAAEKDTTQQALLTEALNDLFTKNRKPPIPGNPLCAW
jgi:hypothetical protein